MEWRGGAGGRREKGVRTDGTSGVCGGGVRWERGWRRERGAGWRWSKRLKIGGEGGRRAE